MTSIDTETFGIKIRLVNSFRLLVVLLIVLGGFSILQMQQLAGYTESLYNHPYTVSTATLRVTESITHMHMLIKDMTSVRSIPELGEMTKELDRHHDLVVQDLQLIETRFLGDKQQVVAVQQAFAFWLPLRERVVALHKAGDPDKIRQFFVDQKEIIQQVNRLDTLVRALTLFAENKAQAFMQKAQHTRDQTILLTLALLIVCVALSWFFFRSVRLPLSSVVNALSTASTQMAASINQQERIATQQAASITETTTTMEELGASSRQSAEQAELAATGAQQALDLAQEGAVRVEETVQSMVTAKQKVGLIAERILLLSEQTGQIRSITDLVSDFANETRMLAMNAAVEAVRAGEHGKGFSVLAMETRKLADESKRSASRINSLIGEIQKATDSTVMATEEGSHSMEKGMLASRNTTETFHEVAQSIGHASQGAQQISLNVRQQSVAIRQVTEAVQSINTGAREAATGMAQVKLGIQTLNNAAQTLKRMI